MWQVEQRGICNLKILNTVAWFDPLLQHHHVFNSLAQNTLILWAILGNDCKAGCYRSIIFADTSAFVSTNPARPAQPSQLSRLQGCRRAAPVVRAFSRPVDVTGTYRIDEALPHRKRDGKIAGTAQHPVERKDR